ncbi:MAG: carbon storage regulator [Planctomycetaceae bacterium]|nr:carbon storage regulator [Planctomycetaceae bacterium]
MLVLTRKKTEMIQIGENIVVKVIRTGKGHVKLGIEAPADVRVLRAELCEEPAEADQTEAALESEEEKPVVLSVA